MAKKKTAPSGWSAVATALGVDATQAQSAYGALQEDEKSSFAHGFRLPYEGPGGVGTPQFREACHKLMVACGVDPTTVNLLEVQAQAPGKF